MAMPTPTQIDFELPYEIRWALTQAAARYAHAKVASEPKAVRRQAVLDTIHRCLGPQPKIACRPNEAKLLQAELASFRLIGHYLKMQEVKQAFLGKAIAGGLSRMIRNPTVAGALGGAAGSGLTMAAGHVPGVVNQMSAGVQNLGQRLGNAYNAFTAVNTGPAVTRMNPAPAAGGLQAARPEVGVPPAPRGRPAAAAPAAPAAPAIGGGINPRSLDADFNKMTVAEFIAYRQALAQRLMDLHQAYPGMGMQAPAAQVAASPPRPGALPMYYNR